MFRTTINSLFTLLVVFPSVGLFAQGEVLSPLTMRPDPRSAAPKNTLNTHFIYEYDTISLPIYDDFSIDRTRQRWAMPDDEGVVLLETIYALVVNGVSTPDMVFALDTTFTYFTDMGTDSVFTYREPLPEVVVLQNDISGYPVEGEDITAWPAYNVFDTLQVDGATTLYLPLGSGVILQDSLLVYLVPPASGVYILPNLSQQPLILWEDDDVYVNGTYPLEPPTIGVATFDGLSRTGLPYDFMNFSAHGKADRLTSVPINMQGLSVADSVYLSFFYQARGLSGDIHGQAIDSLILEFFAPQEDLWYKVWGTPYNATDPLQQPPFAQVLIPIKEFRYLQNGFKMRFTNYATLSGSFDHWHLDYVRLATQRTHDDTVIVDMGYVYPAVTLLETFTSVPYSKFIQSPATLMANTVTLPMRNLDVNDRFINFGFNARIEGGAPFNTETGINTAGNANSIFNSVHPIGGYVYPTPGDVDAAFYDVRFWSFTQPDLIRYNDTTRFVQEISNYYSYDDGSAEMGYGLNTSGGRLAYRFDLLGADSLRAIRMYFNPMANLPPAAHPTTGSFLITIWDQLTADDAGIIHQNFSFSSPEYRQDGLNKFVEFPLDSAIHVEGTIYVGWVQTNNVPMNLGFDRNRNNQNKIFYNVGGTWQNTSFEGSIMMRPVFVSEVDPFVGVVGQESPGNAMVLYPNPATDGFNLRLYEDPVGAVIVQCLDATGRPVIESNYSAGMFISTSALANGVYIVRVTGTQGAVISNSRLIVQR